MLHGVSVINLWTQTLEWRHNGCDNVSNHRRIDCLLNRLFRRRSKKTSKLRVTGVCEGNPPVTGGFPSQRASNTERVSIWRRHHETCMHVISLATNLLMWGEYLQYKPFFAMLTSSDGKWKHFLRYWPICAGNSPVLFSWHKMTRGCVKNAYFIFDAINLACISHVIW